MTLPSEVLNLEEAVKVVYRDRKKPKLPVNLKGCEKLVFWNNEEDRKAILW